MIRYASTLFALLLASSAQAAIVTVQYSSTITSLDFEEYWGAPMNYPDHIDLGSFTISKGETVTGRLTYDDTASPASVSSSGSRDWALNPGGYKFTFEGSGTTFDLTNTLVYTSRGSTLDQFYFGGEVGTQQSGSLYFYSGLMLNAPLGTHDPSTLPGAAELPAYNIRFPDMSNQIFWIKMGGSYVWVSKSDFTLQIISSVPEPATYGMLAAGLGLIGVIARRRKSPTA